MEPGSPPEKAAKPKKNLNLYPLIMVGAGAVILLVIVGAVLFILPKQGANPPITAEADPNAAPIYPNATKLAARAGFKNLISKEYLQTTGQNLTEAEYISADSFDKIVVYLDQQAAKNGWKRANLAAPRDPTAPGILYTYARATRTLIYAFPPVTAAPTTILTVPPDGTYFTVTTFDALPTPTPNGTTAAPSTTQAGS